MKINNEFGHKIGGSKRDLWKARGLMVEDILEMNESEKDKFIKKDNVWPKPDYNALKEQNIPVVAIYFRKKIRDAVSTRPSCVEKRDTYIETVRIIKNLAESIENENDIKNAFDKIVNSGLAICNHGRHYSLSEDMREAGGSKLFRVIANASIIKLGMDIKKKQFLYSDKDRILSKYTFLQKNSLLMNVDNTSVNNTTKDMGLKIPGGWMLICNCTKEKFYAIEDGACIVLSGHDYIDNFETKEEAENMIISQENKSVPLNDEKTKKERKKKFVPKQLEHVKRVGEEYLHRHATADDYIKTFGFYGGEFGTWMSELDRQASLDMGYDAFMDLTKAINIEPIGIGMDGQLSIAFGARGSGSAMAHYEPLRRVINLTKTKGAGSLAHEYGHALDYILSAVINNELQPFSDSCKTEAVNLAFKEVKNAIKYQNGQLSEYYRNSLLFDKCHSKDSQGYWSSDKELFARAFACYVKDTLAEMDIRNDYLCGHADSAVTFYEGKVIKAYPEGDERISINLAIRKFVDELNKLNAFYGCKEISAPKKIKRRTLTPEEKLEYENLTTACRQMNIFDFVKGD